MYRMVKFLYCLQLGNQEFGHRVQYYATFSTLLDQRILSGLNFTAGHDSAPYKLLEYLKNKGQLVADTKERFKIICQTYNFEMIPDSEWEDEQDN